MEADACRFNLGCGDLLKKRLEPGMVKPVCELYFKHPRHQVLNELKTGESASDHNDSLFMSKK